VETTVRIDDQSCIAEARRAAATLGNTMGLSPELVAQASLVISELCTNILKYADRGVLLLSTLSANGTAYGVDIVALDRGPGIANLEAAARDGFSTGAARPRCSTSTPSPVGAPPYWCACSQRKWRRPLTMYLPWAAG
jgi:anti-sigma regulatory factor (Ser/Thr protein kinase)